VHETLDNSPCGLSRHADEEDVYLPALASSFPDMPINHHVPRYEGLAAPTASLGQYESQPPRRRYLPNSRKGPSAGSLATAPHRISAVDDTPLYWQTVQAMASRRMTAGRIIPGRSDGKRGG